MAGDHRLAAKNACAYEQNLRVPLLVSFPGQQEATKSGEMDRWVAVCDGRYRYAQLDL